MKGHNHSVNLAILASMSTKARAKCSVCHVTGAKLSLMLSEGIHAGHVVIKGQVIRDHLDKTDFRSFPCVCATKLADIVLLKTSLIVRTPERLDMSILSTCNLSPWINCALDLLHIVSILRVNCNQ